MIDAATIAHARKLLDEAPVPPIVWWDGKPYTIPTPPKWVKHLESVGITVLPGAWGAK